MASSQSPNRTWPAALLFPFKLYTVIAGFCMLIWHSRLPSAEAVDYDAASKAWWATWDFATVAEYVVVGYFLTSLVLVIGGAVQVLKRPRPSAFFTLAFGIAAFVIGLLLRPYQWEADWRRN